MSGSTWQPIDLSAVLAELTSPPTQPPVLATATSDPDRPCAHCGQMLPVAGPGSSWPWTNRRRICEPCLRKVDN